MAEVYIREALSLPLHMNALSRKMKLNWKKERDKLSKLECTAENDSTEEDQHIKATLKFLAQENPIIV